jgi:hypothetical protein
MLIYACGGETITKLSKLSSKEKPGSIAVLSLTNNENKVEIDKEVKELKKMGF